MKHRVEVVRLNNGAEGLFIHVPGATVMSYELNFRAGEYLVPYEKWEVPHLMEHLMLGANQRYKEGRHFNAEIQKHGAYVNAYTSYYSVSYVGEVADFEWDRVLGLQLYAISHPLFLQKEFKAEWGNVRDELTAYINNHFRRLGGELSKAFGFTMATDEERVELMHNVKRRDLIAHFNRTHFTGNLRFIIAGNLRSRKKRLIRLLEGLDLPRGGERLLLPFEQASKPKKPVFVSNPSVPNIYMYINSYANNILPQTDDDALTLIRIMLTDTLHSKIFGAAREKGIVYSVNSSNHRASQVTEWGLTAQVLPENAPALCDIILSEVRKVRDGELAPRDLNAAKQYALGSFQRSMQTVNGIANAYNRYFFDNYIENYAWVPERIKALNRGHLSEAMTRIFAEDIGTVGVLGGKDPRIAGRLNRQLSGLWR